MSLTVEFSERLPLTSPMVLLSLVALLLGPTSGCMKTAWTQGYLSPETGVQLEAVTAAGSCACCALCHRRADCASLALHTSTGECRMYSTVANYSTLQPDAEWTYLVRPGRSASGQFCRQDSDCADSLPCRGRVCSWRKNITCRVIRDRFGAGDRYGPLAADTPMYGWMNERPLALACLFSPERPGYTRLFRNLGGFRFTRGTIMAHNADLSTGLQEPHSILHLAESIRLFHNSVPTYRLLIETPDLVTIEFTVTRDTPVLAQELRVGLPGVTYTHTGRSSSELVSLPYLPTDGVTLLTTNGHGAQWYQLALAREDGSLSWESALGNINMYILE